LYGLDSNDSPLWLADIVEFQGARQAAINMSSLGDGRTSITILVLGDGESFSARSVAAQVLKPFLSQVSSVPFVIPGSFSMGHHPSFYS
jgi:hypothetical protein